MFDQVRQAKVHNYLVKIRIHCPIEKGIPLQIFKANQILKLSENNEFMDCIKLREKLNILFTVYL